VNIVKDPQVEDMTLAQRLADGPLSAEEALDVLEQLLSGLAVAHSSGLLHGSISPQKVILAPDGRATLIGFPENDAVAQRLAGSARGPAELAFVAPEQIVEHPVDRRTDLYSLGVVVYTMLMGKDPFGASEGLAPGHVFYRIRYKPAPHVPERMLVGLPTSVGRAIDRVLSKEPGARFADAGAFLQALRADSTLVPAAAPERTKKSKATATAPRGAGRLRKPLALAAGIVVLLVIVGVGVAWAAGGIGGGPGKSVAGAATSSTSDVVAGGPATTLADSPITTAPPVTTTTTLPPSVTTLSTVPATTTTAGQTTTTAHATTNTSLKKATITIASATTVYDGSPNHLYVTTKPAGLSVTYSSTPTDAGIYTITVTITAPGYTGSKKAKLTIKKAKATIKVSGWTGTFDNNPHGAHLDSATGVNGESLASSVQLGASFTKVGNHHATWIFSNPNYIGQSQSVLISISAA